MRLEKCNAFAYLSVCLFLNLSSYLYTCIRYIYMIFYLQLYLFICMCLVYIYLCVCVCVWHIYLQALSGSHSGVCYIIFVMMSYFSLLFSISVPYFVNMPCSYFCFYVCSFAPLSVFLGSHFLIFSSPIHFS